MLGGVTQEEEVGMWRRWWASGQAAASALLGGVSVSEAVDVCAARRGAQEALWLERGLEIEGFGHARWSFADVGRFVRRAASALELVGKVQAGERVAVLTGNGVEQPLLSLAVMRCGAVAVPLNPQLRVSEVRYILEDCGAQVAVVDGRALEEVIRPLLAQGGAPSLRCVLVDGEPGAALAGGVASVGLRGAMEGAHEGAPAAQVGEGEVCSLFYTSGTTGFPKGAMLTGEGLLRSAGPLLALPGGGPRTLLLALPSAHIMGFAAFFQALLAGARVVYLSRFVAARVVDWLASGQVDAFVGVPTMYQLMEEAGALSRDLKGVRVFMSAADVMPPGLMGRFKRAGRLARVGSVGPPALFVEMYGSVELAGAAMVRVSLPWLDPVEGAFVGWPLPGVSVEVRGEDGEVRVEGEVGELWVKAAGVLKGYVGQEEATRAAVRGGWLRTGDLGSRGRFGEVYFAGREKEVIKVGGYSVFPAEVEEALRGYPGVSRAVVFGVPEARKGSGVVAVVCPAAGVSLEGEAVLSWVRGEVASYKAPRRVFVMEEGELPYGATGKVQRRLLEARFGGALVEEAGVR